LLPRISCLFQAMYNCNFFFPWFDPQIWNPPKVTRPPPCIACRSSYKCFIWCRPVGPNLISPPACQATVLLRRASSKEFFGLPPLSFPTFFPLPSPPLAFFLLRGVFFQSLMPFSQFDQPPDLIPPQILHVLQLLLCLLKISKKGLF